MSHMTLFDVGKILSAVHLVVQSVYRCMVEVRGLCTLKANVATTSRGPHDLRFVLCALCVVLPDDTTLMF